MSRRLIRILLLTFLGVTVFFVIRGMKTRHEDDTLRNFNADGLKMNQTIFNENNKRIIELSSSESSKDKNDRIVMKNLNARILKKGKLSEDISIHGDEGFVANNYHNFSIAKNAWIESPKFRLTGEKFFLKDRAILTSAVPVDYRTSSSVKGKAAGGMQFFLNHNVLKFFKTRGIYRQGQKNYHYTAQTLWFLENQRRLLLENKAAIKGPESLLQGNRISLTFDKELKYISESACSGKAHLRTEQRETDSFRDLRSDRILSFFDKTGSVSRIELKKDAVIHLKTSKKHARISADNIIIRFTPGGEQISEVSITTPGRIISRGGTDFSVSADAMTLTFAEGELTRCKALGAGKLKSAEISAKAESIDFSVKKETIVIQGPDTRIVNKNNVFTSKKFQIDQKKRTFFSDSEVKSVINPAQEMPPFSGDNFLISSKKVSYSQKREAMEFSGQVLILQGRTRLTADRVRMNKSGGLSASGNTGLSFFENKKESRLSGGKLSFSTDKKKIAISDQASIQSGSSRLQASELQIAFQAGHIDTITGNVDVRFSKDKITGQSQSVLWNFRQENIIFKKSASITRSSGGTARGRKLEFDLKNNLIKIRSAPFSRTETLLRDEDEKESPSSAEGTKKKKTKKPSQKP